jgi:orotate phosphoribosyltransferase
VTVEAHKQAFIDFMLRVGVLTFGDFTTKSGRKTPYFVNTGRYRTGAQMRELCGYYARTIHDRFEGSYDFLFGPAYKGIPLCVGTAMALAERHGVDVPFCFNRKEAKDHGEGGLLVGHVPEPGQRALFVEDVTTAGTSIRETLPLLEAVPGVRATGLVISVDRMERGTGTKNALAELGDTHGMQTAAIVSVREIMEYLRGRSVDGRVVLDDRLHGRMLDYLAEYGGTT